MYVPAHFKPDDADVLALLGSGRAANLITATAGGLMATMLPLVCDGPEARAGPGAAGARCSGTWHGTTPSGRRPRSARRWSSSPGPDAYISPAWYATKREHGRVVPTWNYITVHAYGRLVIHDDPAWVEANVRRLTGVHEGARAEPWSVDDAPEPYIEGQLRAIVGVEILDRPRPGQVEAQPEPLRRATSRARSRASRRPANDDVSRRDARSGSRRLTLSR